MEAAHRTPPECAAAAYASRPAGALLSRHSSWQRSLSLERSGSLILLLQGPAGLSVRAGQSVGAARCQALRFAQINASVLHSQTARCSTPAHARRAGSCREVVAAALRLDEERERCLRSSARQCWRAPARRMALFSRLSRSHLRHAFAPLCHCWRINAACPNVRWRKYRISATLEPWPLRDGKQRRLSRQGDVTTMGG